MTNGVKGFIRAAPPFLVGEFGEFGESGMAVVVEVSVTVDGLVTAEDWELVVCVLLPLGSALRVVSTYAFPIGSPWQTCTDSILNGGLCANA